MHTRTADCPPPPPPAPPLPRFSSAFPLPGACRSRAPLHCLEDRKAHPISPSPCQPQCARTCARVARRARPAEKRAPDRRCVWHAAQRKTLSVGVCHANRARRSVRRARVASGGAQLRLAPRDVQRAARAQRRARARAMRSSASVRPTGRWSRERRRGGARSCARTARSAQAPTRPCMPTPHTSRRHLSRRRARRTATRAAGSTSTSPRRVHAAGTTRAHELERPARPAATCLARSARTAR